MIVTSPARPGVAKDTDMSIQLASRMDRLGTETAFEVLVRAKALEARGATSSTW